MIINMITGLLRGFLMLMCMGLCVLWYLTTTTPGLDLAVQLVESFLPGIEITAVRGQLFHHVEIGSLTYREHDQTINARHLVLTWRLLDWHHIKIEHLTADSVSLTQGNETKTLHSINVDGQLIFNDIMPLVDLNIVSTITLSPDEDWKLTSHVKGTPPWNWRFKAQLARLQTNHPLGLSTTILGTGQLDKEHGALDVTVKPGQYVLPGTNTLFNEFVFESGKLSVSCRNDACQANGVLMSHQKQLMIKGQASMKPALKCAVSMSTVEYPLIQTDEYRVHVSPNVTLSFSSEQLGITGNIDIPYADIKPHSFANSISVPDDVIFKTPKPVDQTPSWPIAIHTEISVGDKVTLNAKGLSAHLTGLLHVDKATLGPINASGALQIKEGTYQAYGQNLTIDQGRLFFTGGQITQPMITLRAIKQMGTTSDAASAASQSFGHSSALQHAKLQGKLTVGVETSGPLADPSLHLFSSPLSMSQADILSMLILGKPASQADKAGTQTLLTALSSMGNKGAGGNFIQQLKEKTGIDMNLSTNSRYNVLTREVSDTTGVTFGKSITEKMYLSYKVGLSQNDPNVLTLTYLLNALWDVELSTSTTQSAIDFLYTFKSKRP